MKGWKEFKLNELGKVNRGKSKHRPRNEPTLFNGKYPFIQTGDIKAANFYVRDYSQTYSEKGLAQSKLWKKDTLCITIAANIAETAVLGIEACFPDSIIGFIADESKSDVKFIKYHFDLLKIHLQSISQGTTQDNLSQEKLLKFNFSVPVDVNAQKQIASIIFNYDNLIEVNNQRIKLLEQTARELYKEWFVRMRFPEHKTIKIVKGLPKDWEIKELKDFGKIFTGKTPPTKVREYYGGEIPFIKTPDLHKSLFVFDTEENLTEKGNNTQKRSTLPKNAICVSCIGTGGIVSITTAEKSQTNQQINSLVLSDLKQLEFLYHRITDLKETIELFGGTGATMTNLSKGKFEKLKILFPTKELIESYHHLVNPMFNQIKTLQQQNTQLRQIRNRLLPRLISGKLQVKAANEEAKVIPLKPTQGSSAETESMNKSNPYFKRRVLAAYLIDHLKDEITFGHVKLMKLMYLCEHLAKVETLSNYHRDAAGPYDNQMIRSIDSQLKKAKWFECVKIDPKYTYKPLEKKEEYKAWFAKYYSDEESGIESLLSIFGKKKTIEAEKVATLYEAYRFLNEKNKKCTDKDVMHEVLNNWHESKQRISESEWHSCLNWMREKNWIS
jgi:type I restriction enzyme S subunit